MFDLNTNVNEVTVQSFSNKYPCGDTPGFFTKNFCCGAQEGSKAAEGGCCGDTDFEASTLGGFGGFANKAGGAANVSSESASSASPSSSSKPSASPSSSTTASATPDPAQALAQTSSAPISSITSTPSHSSNHSAVIGAGVGVPLGLLSLAGLGFLLYREHRSRKGLEAKLRHLQGSPFDDREEIDGSGKSARYVHELHNWERKPEPHQSQRGELGGHERAEMGVRM